MDVLLAQLRAINLGSQPGRRLLIGGRQSIS